MNDSHHLNLRLIPGRFCICRFPPSTRLMDMLSDPTWSERLQEVSSLEDNSQKSPNSDSESWWSISRTPDEWSLVIPQSWIDDLLTSPIAEQQTVRCEQDRSVIEVEGPLPLDWVGVMAGLSGVLAKAGISIFCISTFDTDYILVESSRVHDALDAFRTEGYGVHHP